MYRLHGAIHAYGGTTVSARDTADSVITALSPAAWYRNATGVTSAGGFASQWDDYSGNGRHLAQTTGTNQPAYAAGVLSFDGADNWMKVTGGFTLNQPETIIAVLQQDTWTASDKFFDGNTVNTGLIQQVTATPQIGAYGGSSSTTSSDLAVGAYGIICVVFNGASSVLRVNNNADITGNFGALNMGGLTLGSAGNTTSSWADISIKEFIVFASALSDANRTAVITALNNALTVF